MCPVGVSRWDASGTGGDRRRGRTAHGPAHHPLSPSGNPLCPTHQRAPLAWVRTRRPRSCRYCRKQNRSDRLKDVGRRRIGRTTTAFPQRPRAQGLWAGAGVEAIRAVYPGYIVEGWEYCIHQREDSHRRLSVLACSRIPVGHPSGWLPTRTCIRGPCFLGTGRCSACGPGPSFGRTPPLHVVDKEQRLACCPQTPTVPAR